MSSNEYIIDLEGVESEDDLHDRLEESLPLPDYYGRNLDALYDVLTEYGDGWHVVIENIDLVDEEIRPYVDDMIGVFEDASAVAPDLTIEYDEEDSYFDDDID